MPKTFTFSFGFIRLVCMLMLKYQNAACLFIDIANTYILLYVVMVYFQTDLWRVYTQVGEFDPQD
jgi:hypothetical protein